MEGNSDNIGMIPRAVLQIYNTAQKLSEKGWKFQISAQFLEIYNETVKDLLCDAVSEADLKITHGRDGKTTVANSIVVEVTNPDQVSEVLKTASKNRAVAATNCNERSSRSHSVFMLTIVGENSVTGEKTSAVLNLIDLAGSERLSSSGSSGDRLKETQAINKSLSSLGDVISALAEKSQHVPYRNSKVITFNIS